jgi:hypothetical protein
MLTIMTSAKPFQGHIGVIQRNAIRSWTLLSPRPEVILFGNEEGVAQCAAELSLLHVPNVARNHYGTPLLADIFAQAERCSANDLFAYINTDIILPSEFMRGLESIRRSFPRFLAVGRRTNLDVTAPLDFSTSWEAKLKDRLLTEGALESHTGIDFFAFPRGTYPDVPPLAIGRVWFDQWCIKYARKNGIPVIDMTPFVPLVHQLHDYNHVAGGKQWVYGGAEADENLAFYGERPHAYTLLDVTHELTPRGGIRRVRFRKPLNKMKNLAWKVFVERTVGIRNALGLRRKFWQKSSIPPHS